MSHVGNGEDDFKDMEGLSENGKKCVRRVRMLAREIIDMLEPRHINTLSRLIEILDDAQRMARVDRFLQDPSRSFSRKHLEEKPYRLFGQNIRDAIRILRRK